MPKTLQSVTIRYKSYKCCWQYLIGFKAIRNAKLFEINHVSNKEFKTPFSENSLKLGPINSFKKLEWWLCTNSYLLSIKWFACSSEIILVLFREGIWDFIREQYSISRTKNVCGVLLLLGARMTLYTFIVWVTRELENDAAVRLAT